MMVWGVVLAAPVAGALPVWLVAATALLVVGLWVTPAIRITGEFITAADWNQDVVANTIALRSGQQEFPIPITAFRPHVSGGSGPVEDVLLSSGIYIFGMPFDATSIEAASFGYRFPKRVDFSSSITFRPMTVNTAGGAGGYVFDLAGVASTDDDSLDAAVGTPQISADTALAAKDFALGPISSAITLAGSPAAGDWTRWRTRRDPTHGSDTYASDVYLLGVVLILNTNSSDDA